MAIQTATNKVSLQVNNSNALPDAYRDTFRVTTIAAAGTTQATGTAIGNTQPFVLISNNTAANGLVLPVAAYIGQTITIYPQLITNAPLVYPPVGGTINSAAVNAGVATPARKASEFICVDRGGLTWVTNGL
jgi:hypothetical protein